MFALDATAITGAWEVHFFPQLFSQSCCVYVEELLRPFT